MGHKRKQTIYKLVFEDPEYHDLEVRARSMPLGQYLEMMAIFDEGGLTKDNSDKLFAMFADVLIDWNIEDDEDQPVSATVEGLYSLELEEARTIISAWRDAVAGVSRPFGGELDRWRAVPGGVDSDGNPAALKPRELIHAELILGLCERFGCLPSQLLAEDAELLRLMEIVHRGRREEV